MTEVIGGGTGSSGRQENLTVREKVEGEHKLFPRSYLTINFAKRSSN